MSTWKASNAKQIAVTAALAIVAISLIHFSRTMCSKSKVPGSRITESSFLDMVESNKIAAVRIYPSRKTLLIVDVTGSKFYLSQPTRLALDAASQGKQGFDISRADSSIDKVLEYCPRQ